MSLRECGNGVRDCESDAGFENSESQDRAGSEQETRRKAASRKRNARLIRSTPRQWVDEVAIETLLSKETVRLVISATMRELERRVLLGEAVMLPVGCLEPARTGRVFRDLEGELTEDPIKLKIRTTYKFRKKYQKSLQKFNM